MLGKTGSAAMPVGVGERTQSAREDMVGVVVVGDGQYGRYGRARRCQRGWCTHSVAVRAARHAEVHRNRRCIDADGEDDC